MKYLAAVSGGVDSVVLLDILIQHGHQVIVAHVDHGIRPESDADARFVEGLARLYGCRFVTTRFELGASASEQAARTVRYDFLFAEAKKHRARLATAHHRDDLIETIAINLHRGTGWRGLSVLARDDIERPLLGLFKREIYEYARLHRLEWVEDETNRTDKYLRNRMRRKIFVQINEAAKVKVAALREEQLALRNTCDQEIRSLLSSDRINRYFLSCIDQAVAMELLGSVIYSQSGVNLTRPMLERAMIAIKTARAGSMYQVGGGVWLKLLARDFVVKTP